jgi:hypothetical protein
MHKPLLTCLHALALQCLHQDIATLAGLASKPVNPASWACRTAQGEPQVVST